MFNFTGPTVDRDGGLDAEILMHELTHGTSNRIIGNGTGLTWDIGGGMGEGWSDFYALSLLNNTNADNPNGRYASGAYATYKAFGVTTYQDNYVYGIRRFPYTTDNTINPMTWADVDQVTNNLSGGMAADPLGFNFGGAAEVHNAGEIWTLTLWVVRSRIIAANGGSVPTGNQIMLQLVTDAMKMTPINPSFLQARDALIAADCATNACANENSIWNGFADRGLGYNARVKNAVSFTPTAPHVGVVESFTAPNLDINTIAITDTVGNNSGFIDPNEPFRFEINIKNPWRNASRTATGITATMTSSTAGVTILNATTTYPNIAPNTNAVRNAFNIVAKAPLAAACGSSMNFTLTITSSLGTVARTFSLRIGAPTGTQAPVTYSAGTLGLAIADNSPVGVGSTINVPDDFEVADVDVRIDAIVHAFPGDLTFSVKGPNGYGTDLLAYLGGSVSGGGNGDNITNMRFDDDAPTGEVLSATNLQAPYTGTWRPVFNSPVWATLGFPSADATPQLSNFDGSSSLGAWRAIASDQAAVDAGTLNGWSLIITPRAFTCTPFAPTAANVDVSGQVVDATGRGISNVLLTLSGSSGEPRQARSNTFGYFHFGDVVVGRSYILDASSRRFSFASQVISVQDQVAGIVVAAQ
jgi:subtilisin-like proprotein convertase family protein